MFLPTNTILVSFDIVNMCPNIDNKSGLDAEKSLLLKRSTNTTPVECILEGLDLCLTLFLIIGISYKLIVQQKDHMPCWYSDNAMSKLNINALQYHLKPTLWKRFLDDILAVWTHGTDTLESFLDWLF